MYYIFNNPGHYYPKENLFFVNINIVGRYDVYKGLEVELTLINLFAFESSYENNFSRANKILKS